MMTTKRTFHFDLSFLDTSASFDFHRGPATYPIERHTHETRARAFASDSRLASIEPSRLTHYVTGVATSPSDGVIIQRVTTAVLVAGPNGPNTQTYDKLVSYSIDIGGSSGPVIGTKDLAYALIFLHSSLVHLGTRDASNNSIDLTIPIFIFDRCVVPNAYDLITQLENLTFQGQSWISEPYAVMPVLGKLMGSEDPEIAAILSQCAGGGWAYSQRLHADRLNPALPDCIGAAIKAAKNASELEGICWNVLGAVVSSSYNATSSLAAEAAAAIADSGDVVWTVSDLTPGHGLTVDASSLVVDMDADTDNPSYAGKLTIDCKNHWLRHLGVYVEFLTIQGEGDTQVLVPIPLGSSNDTFENPNNPGVTVEANQTWPGDWVNKNDYFFNGDGFLEPSTTKKYLAYLTPVNTIFGIPTPAGASTLEVRYIPTEANVIRLMWGGMGRGPYDAQVCAVGVGLTAVFEFALPVILAVAGVAEFDASSAAEFADKGNIINLLNAIWSVVNNGLPTNGATVGQDAEAIGQFFAETLLPYILKSTLGGVVVSALGAGMVITALPILNVVFQAISLAVTAAQLAQTIDEVAQSPFVFKTDIRRTFSLSLTVNPDQHAHEFSPEAIDGTCRVAVHFSSNATPAVVELPMGSTTRSQPITVEMRNLPAGGQIRVSVYLYAPNGWQAGQGVSDWYDAKGAGAAPDPAALPVSVWVSNNTPPLDRSSVYQFLEKIIYQGGGRSWRGIDSDPAATQPLATRQTDTGITELNGLTLCQDAGILGYTFQAAGLSYTAQSLSLLQDPQSAYVASAGLTVKPALAYQRICPSDGSGLNFLLDTNHPQAIGLGELRRLALTWTESNGSEPPDMNPQPADGTWGVFPFPMDRMAAFNRHIVGISYDSRHSKIFVVEVPDAVATMATAPKAYMISGPGTRVGLIYQPRAITFGMQGQILVLEQGCPETKGPRVQAFDVNGNSLWCFDPTGSGTKQGTMPVTQATDQTVLLDLAVEPRGYIYILSYEGLGGEADDYHLDLYRPDGAFLVRTTGFAAANIAVDIFRNVYCLNYEALETPNTPEPSISLWIPPVPPGGADQGHPWT